MKKITVRRPGSLLEYLMESEKGIKRTTVKNYLRFKSVWVNGHLVTRFDYPLKAGDEIVIQTDKHEAKTEILKSRLPLLYEDDTVVVIEKPEGLLTIATDKVKTQTAFYQVHEYLKHSSGEKKKQLFIVHRLDRDASGLLLLAKSFAAKLELQRNWQKFEKRYWAVVEGTPENKSGAIESYLRENKFLKVYATERPAEGAKYSVTHYRVLRSGAGRSLLEVRLETGRKHQIRVHLSEIGHPIAGDERYGNKDRDAERLMLHACFLSFRHPVTQKVMTFNSEVPESFEKMLREEGGKKSGLGGQKDKLFGREEPS